MWHPVDSTLVHKKSASQVLLVAAEDLGAGSLGIDVALSPDHPLAGRLPLDATLLGVEMMRQCAIAFAHRGGGVPLGWAFLMNELTFNWHGGKLPESPGQFTGRVHVRLCASRMRKGQISDLQLEADYVSGNVILGSGHGDLSVLPPQTFRAIRRNAPAMTGEDTGALGVVLAGVNQMPGVLNAQLVWNFRDRFIFDHVSDHLSGMLFARAALQSHLLVSGSQALEFSLRCENFAEYDDAVHISSSSDGSGATLTTITQSGRNIAFGRCIGPRIMGTAGPEAGRFHRQLTPAP
ncbi:AfsA-related hotdog domain-containing protein [Arthrobacter sp. N199823]|uniref:AfsA-related hotdog domain-containing protein n=1 Tax=Arthrobacter sp. N199823 TaxID=2058895 RepID=UPI0015E3CD5C|nr:AfsA-related hotdog domain-containing protein [Arthrobacter sp. N199823]